ncbi:CHASE2 domain-containing protein [Laspinema olomoucense]|uniref:CHASE2 domain-containing protein n=1 Tax=Laspinema olomoucense TaxID=3231600 RepID=UPI0021BA4781|nr:CHASE2 domain-containing protein [Laspinema sp. D3c]MCT7997555.1 CHASE2 domain-containing protein [Laspinema sp. D3c]
MAKLVKLSLEGNLETGYQVELIQIAEEQRDGKTFVEGIFGTLPPAADIYQSYETWQKNYGQLDLVFRGEFRFIGSEVSANVSLEQCQEIAEVVKQKINDWLDCPGFRPISDKILTNLDPAEDIRLLIKTTDYKLWQLPWSAWDFFESYPNAEVVFSAFDSRYGEKPIKVTPRKNVRILGVFGDASNINTHPDRDQIERLKSVGAEPTLVPEPSVQKLRNLLWDKSWDIFFFAGHGDREKSLNQGKIYLNSEESLTPSEFKNSLKTAIVDHGLKIVFLNSCLGLEFAYQLVTEFGIPVVIAMREPIPDRAAQKFLEYFLVEYADNGRPLYVAVRRAKERIAEEWQTHYPGLDWLPVVCQNPASLPPKWRNLYAKLSFQQATLTSLACTLFVLAIKFLGVLHGAEIVVYDKLMVNRSMKEEPDPRILVVNVSGTDLKKLQEDPLQDITVETALARLEESEPSVIGLDIYRDIPQPKQEKSARNALLQRLTQSERIVSVCKVRDNTVEESEATEVAAPSENFPSQKLGFTDLVKDDDFRVRRHLVFQDLIIESKCQAQSSFSFSLVFKYLKSKGVNLDITKNNELKFKNTVLARLRPYRGIYYGQEASFWDGYQILLNYRSLKNVEKIGDTVSFTDLLDGKITPDRIKNKIVIIGYNTGNGSRDADRFVTPYGELSGITIHGHMVSQIISAVEDGRPLLQVLPWWGDTLVIFGCTLIGAVVYWRFQKKLYRGIFIVGGIAFIIIPSINYIFFIKGFYLPLLPSLVSLTSLSLTLWIIVNFDKFIVSKSFPNLKQNLKN